MKHIILSLISIFLICVSSRAMDSSSSSKEVIEITITKHGNSYATQAIWFEYNIDEPEHVNVLAKPKVSSISGGWGAIKVATKDSEFYGTTKLLLDGKLIEFPNGYGTTFLSKVTAKDDRVYAKGVFSVTQKESTFSIPFEGIFKVGERTIIFEQTKHFGRNAQIASQRPIETEPFKVVSNGSPIQNHESLFEK